MIVNYAVRKLFVARKRYIYYKQFWKNRFWNYQNKAPWLVIKTQCIVALVQEDDNLRVLENIARYINLRRGKEIHQKC